MALRIDKKRIEAQLKGKDLQIFRSQALHSKQRGLKPSQYEKLLRYDSVGSWLLVPELQQKCAKLIYVYN